MSPVSDKSSGLGTELPTATAVVASGDADDDSEDYRRHGEYILNPSDEDLARARHNRCAFSLLCFIVGSAGKRGGVWTPPKNIRFFNFLGLGTEIDFAQARFVHRTIYVSAYSFLGGDLKITVPPGVRLIARGVNILGNVRLPAGGASETVGAALHTVDEVTIIVTGASFALNVVCSVDNSVAPVRLRASA